MIGTIALCDTKLFAKNKLVREREMGRERERHKIYLLTPIDKQFSSCEFGNLTITLDPAFSSLSFSGRKRHTTLMLSSAAISRSADIFNYHTLVLRLSLMFSFFSSWFFATHTLSLSLQTVLTNSIALLSTALCPPIFFLSFLENWHHNSSSFSFFCGLSTQSKQNFTSKIDTQRE